MSAQRVSRKFERQTVYAQGDKISAYNPSSSSTWGPKITDLVNDPVYGGNTDNQYTAEFGKHEVNIITLNVQKLVLMVGQLRKFMTT